MDFEAAFQISGMRKTYERGEGERVKRFVAEITEKGTQAGIGVDWGSSIFTGMWT